MPVCYGFHSFTLWPPAGSPGVLNSSGAILPRAVATRADQTRMRRAAVWAVGSRRGLPRRAQRRTHVLDRPARSVVRGDEACLYDPARSASEGRRTPHAPNLRPIRPPPTPTRAV